MSFSPNLNRVDQEQKETKEQNQREESAKEVDKEEKEKKAKMLEEEKEKTNGDDPIYNGADELKTKEQLQGPTANGRRREWREGGEEEEEEEEEEEKEIGDKPRYKLVSTSLVPSSFTRFGWPRSFDKQFILATNDKKMKRRIVDEKTYETLKRNGAIAFGTLSEQ